MGMENDFFQNEMVFVSTGPWLELGLVQQDISQGQRTCYTDGKNWTRGSLQLKNMLNSTTGMPSASGEILLIFSPHEYAQFQHGKMTRYFCSVQFDKSVQFNKNCRASVANLSTRITMSRRRGAYKTEFLMCPSIPGKIFGKKITEPDPSCTLMAIDGIDVQISYTDGKYFISARQ
jgi:hypothetical protein